MENPNYKGEGTARAEWEAQSQPPPYPVDPAPPYTAVHFNASGGPPYPTVSTIYTPNGPNIIQMQPIAATTVIVTQRPGLLPYRVQCPHCQADVTTRISHTPGMMTHMCACLICCLFWPCVFIPYVTECTQDVIHTCPNCSNHIATYRQ